MQSKVKKMNIQNLWLCVILVLNAEGCPAWAQEEEITSEPEVIVVYESPPKCSLDAPEWATDLEVAVWNDICTTGLANLSDHNAGACANNVAKLDMAEYDFLSSEFFVELLTNEALLSVRRKGEITVQCAYIPFLELEDLNIRSTLNVVNSVFETVRLSGAEFQGGLSFKSSHFKYNLNLGSIEVAGSLLLTNAKIDGDLNLQDAGIRRNIDLERATGHGSFNGAGITVGGSIFLRNQANFRKVDLLHASVGRSLEAQDSSFVDGLSADSANIGGYIFLNRSSVGNLNLLNARVGKDIEAFNGKFKDVFLQNASISGSFYGGGSRFLELFNASGIEVSGDFTLGARSEFSRVNMLDAKIGGNLNAQGSLFSELLDASRSSIAGSIFFRGGGRFTDVSLLGSSIGGDLEAQRSAFSGHFDATGISVAGSVLMFGESKFSRVTFNRASIGGNVDAAGARVTEKLSLGNARIDGTVYVNNNAHIGAFDFGGMQVRGDLRAQGSEFTGAFSGPSAIIGGWIDLGKNASFKNIDLNGAKVEGNVSAIGSQFYGPFSAESAAFGGSVFLRDGSTFKDVYLIGSNIKGQLQLQGSFFSGDVDLTSLSSGALVLYRGRSRDGKTPPQEVMWGSNAQLKLRNSQFETLQARMRRQTQFPGSWSRADDSILPVDLVGLRLSQLGTFSRNDSFDAADIDAPALIEWINVTAQATGNSYRPQPYQTIESVLLAMGHEDAAKQVEYARHLHRAETRISADWHSDFTTWLEQLGAKVVDRILQISVGFGVYPARGFYWFLLLVAGGALVARTCPRLCKDELGRVTWGDSFFYSLQNATPLIDISSDYDEVHHATLWKRMFFNAQKIIGFVLATILIGTLAIE